jgi:PLD-like domain
MVSLSSTASMIRAIDTAGNVTFSAYVMRRQSAVEKALMRAAARGARVSVRLNGYFNAHNGTPHMYADNVEAVAALKDAGVDARLVHSADNDGPALHIKAAVCDRIAYLDDCNWIGSDETVVCVDGKADVKAIRKAASYVQPKAHVVQLSKAPAIKSEAALLRSSPGGADVIAEELGKSPVLNALKKLARAHGKVRLLISPGGAKGTYRDAVQQLIGAGAQVRVSGRTEKFAVSRDGRAWLGSANPTSIKVDGNQFEWGLRTQDSKIVRALESRFNSVWRDAYPLK